jgi:type IV secretory pathway VirB9-like protein
MKQALQSFVLASFCAALACGQGAAAKHPADTAHPAVSPPAPNPGAPAAEPEAVARVVHYGDQDVIRLKAKLRYTTLIVLPKSENILDFTCGDKEFWVVNGAQNMAYVKPAKVGAQTNLNLITASGNIYSFVLAEVSELPDSAPDLKVFVEPRDESMLSAANAAPRFVSAQALEDYQQQIQIAKEETRQVKQSAQTEIDSGIDRFLTSMRFPYRFDAGKKPFYVRAIYNDEKFTYIQARPEETPALYEIEDGKPNLVNFDYKNGVYVVQKILDRGYLAIGKEKLNFSRED